MPTQTNKIRPPVVDDYDDKGQREVRTAIQQLAAAGTGRYLGRQILANSGIYTPKLGAVTAHAWIIGGGGGGGGASLGAGVGTGAGGGSGVLLDIVVTNQAPLTGGPFSCGAGGAGGANTGAAGGNGGDTTVMINGATYTAKGGSGGGGMVGVAVNGDALPVPPPSGTSGGGFVSYGLGSEGTVDDGNAWHSGRGGSTGLGGGGGQVGGSNAGLAADTAGYGGGGGGATASAGTAHIGGAGAAGGIIIDEYS